MALKDILLGFLLGLGPLIILHELGHYWAARLCGVKVRRFSIGMGRVVWSRRFGPDQTEWAVSILPVGGYVKLVDSRDPGSAPVDAGEEAREFTRQNVWKRIAIIAAGPAVNFIVAIALMAGLFMVGKEEPGTRLRAMQPNTPAYVAGMRGGDAVSAVNGKAVDTWGDLRWELVQAAMDKREAELQLRGAGGGSYRAVIPAATMAHLDAEGDMMGALGMQMWRPRPLVEEVKPDGAAARAGLRKGDMLVAIDGKPLNDGVDLIAAVSKSPGRTLQLDLLRDGQPHARRHHAGARPGQRRRHDQAGGGAGARDGAGARRSAESLRKGRQPRLGRQRDYPEDDRQDDYRRGLAEERIGTADHRQRRRAGRARGFWLLRRGPRLHQPEPGCNESVTNSRSGWRPIAVLFAGSFDRAPLVRAIGEIAQRRRVRPDAHADGARRLQRPGAADSDARRRIRSLSK
jgi:membrane-associated protease RseP (regulator of RpoE activity)